MNKIVKYSLLGAAGVVGIAAVGGAYIAATFNPNDYKDQIIQAVEQSKHRTLKLDGDIKLMFFPSIGANLGHVSLSEFRRNTQFAAIDSAQVSLSLLPLLSKQIVVNEVRISGLTATLIKHKDGTSNIDDLLGSDKKSTSSKTPFKFDIASVSISKTNLTYRDESTGAQYTIHELNLKTGRIANGVPGKIKLSVGIQGNRPKLDIQTQLKTTLTFDLDQKFYQMTGMDFRISGSTLDISNLHLKATGDASVNLLTQEFTAHKFELNTKGNKAKAPFEVRLEVPELNLSKDKFTGEKIILNAKLDSSNIIAALSLPNISGNAQSFKVKQLALNLSMQLANQTINVKLNSPLSGNLDAKRFNLDDLKIAVSGTLAKLPGKALNSEMKGSVHVDLKQQTVLAQLAGGLLQSQIKARVGVKNFSHPAIRFNVAVDQFDADLYLPKKTTQAKPEPVEQPLDLSALRKLNLDGNLRIGKLKVANIKSSKVNLEIHAHKGQVDISPMSANLYQGRMKGSLRVNAVATPEIRIIQNINGINVSALTKDAASFDTLEGHGKVVMNLIMRGNTVSAMKRAINGNFSLNLVDGAIKGINVAKKIRDAQGLFGKAKTQSANQTEKTDFSELKASFKVKNGVAHNDDLSMKSPLLRLKGKGDINIGQNSMDYIARATVAKTLKGQGGKNNVAGITVPVRVSGPFSDLKYTLDFGAMVSSAAKQKVEAKKAQIKTHIQDQLKNTLKGLFR
ncbi:MAG: AsmA family protein [Gallionella sp.]